ncbi:hypothetical protein [Pyrococcus kukulkanii]|uniref:Glycine zipper domain-containing protein n=1 Tax=Pyrococcus kukulkanii TaxID=1609559 RepID=A0A127B7W9_9EURY|nr:hypothetical protein [Pyrococcus kukulkanii]AMM53481.1 hypothetical protein TQ32_02495 [Pyrococcus kukulkanii]
MLFSKIFSFLKRERKDREGKKKGNEQRRERKKALTSATLILMLLVSIYSEPVAALDLKSLFSKSPAGFLYNFWKGYFSTVKNNGLGAIAGAWAGCKVGGAVGAAIGSVVPGVGNAVGGALGCIGGAVAGAFFGASAEQKLKDKITNSRIYKWIFGNNDKEKTSLSILQPRNISYNEYASKTTLLEVFNTTFVNMSELLQAEAKDFQELMARLAPKIGEYDLEEADGNVGEFKNVEIEGPYNIYGFSAIPIKFTLSPRGNEEVKDPICLTSVSIYAYTKDGRKLWTRTWTFKPGEKCGEEGTVWSFETVLKGPDPYVNEIDKIINGLADADTVQKLYLATPADEPYEIVAEVHGIRMIYYNKGGQWIFDHNETISARWRTSSAYKHLAAGRIEIGGFREGTLPVDMKDDPKASMFVPYLMRGSGAASNIIVRAWANPLHIVNATSTFKFYVGANTKFFDELINDFKVEISDESRIVVYRILKDGHWELAATLPMNGLASLGDLRSPTHLEGAVTYHESSNVASYRVFFAIKAYVKRDDGIKIPIWLLIEPNIAVMSNVGRVVRLDPTFRQIEDLTSDNEWSAYDAEQARALVDTVIKQLKDKIETAEYWIERGSQLGNKDVVEYAKKAKEHYEEAIRYAEKIKSANNINDVIRYLEIVRDEEIAGDYYLEAARQASFNNKEQAETLAETAEKVSKVANKYKGGVAALPIPTDWSDIRELVPFIIRIVVSILAIYIARQLFGTVGALVVGIIVGLWWVGPMFGFHL